MVNRTKLEVVMVIVIAFAVVGAGAVATWVKAKANQEARRWEAWCAQVHQTIENDLQLGAVGDADALRRFAAGNVVGDSERETRACAGTAILMSRTTCPTPAPVGPTTDETKQCLLQLMTAAARATLRKEDSND